MLEVRSLPPRLRPLAAVTLVLLAGLAGCQGSSDSPAATAAPAVVPVAMPSAGLPDFAGLVARVGPAVVNITSVTPGTEVAGPVEEGPFGDFFKRHVFGLVQPEHFFEDLPAFHALVTRAHPTGVHRDWKIREVVGQRHRRIPFLATKESPVLFLLFVNQADLVPRDIH